MEINRDWKQYIIVNKGLGMSAGKMSVQVGHACQAFLTRGIQNSVIDRDPVTNIVTCQLLVDGEMFDNWLAGVFTKICLQVKNEYQMERVVERLIENGFIEGVHFFKIIDIGTTEFNGEPHWTCIGLIPMDSTREDLRKALKGLQVYRDN